METQKPTFIKALKAGAIAGIIGAAANNAWLLIAKALGATIPAGFAIPVVVSSIFSVLVGAVFFFLLLKFLSKGKLIWYIVGGAISVLSIIPVFNTPALPDGTVLDSTFPLLAAPMHLISGFLATWGIPKWAK
jgi:Family of unknown function (DUF6069)